MEAGFRSSMKLLSSIKKRKLKKFIFGCEVIQRHQSLYDILLGALISRAKFHVYTSSSLQTKLCFIH